MESPFQQQLAELEQRLVDCMVADCARFRSRIVALRRRLRREQPIDRGLRELDAAISASIQRTSARRGALPTPTFSDELPICHQREEIARALIEHQVIVVCGETGSGKTTQLPKLCLSLGFGVRGSIGHTQPRRIAARTVAARIAEELDSELGHLVGYKIRFSDHSGAQSLVKLMTDGILLAEIQSDPLLQGYEVIIVDEAHERSLNIDFLLGYLKLILPKRPDLKVIITSATIDPQRFSRHFGAAPIIQVSGRTYPVEVRYRPPSGDEDSRDREQTSGILEAVDELARLSPGDVLVFLATEREIRETAEALRKHHPPHTEILPLYARLGSAEQNRVFSPHAGRRIVLATNVAETSLTVPGIRYVIDAGRARISRYSLRSKVQRLPVEAISQASADQRKGRCGRLSAGVCIRLYAEDDFLQRPQFTEPEILRTNLASVILQMVALGLGAVERFPFLEPPDTRQINDGYRLLLELGAVGEDRRIVALGRTLSRLPLDPRLARMIVAARDYGCVAEVLVVAAALSVRDPRERPLDAQQAADAEHARFADQRSDFVTYLNLWGHVEERRRHLSTNKLRKLCKEEYLSWMRIREWDDIHRQLTELVSGMGLRINQEPADYASFHKAILSGLLGHVALKDERGFYLGARNRKLHVFPGSSVARKGPKWLMAAELVETSRLFARTVARIEPVWIEELGAHLVKRSYSNVHWEKRVGRIAASEQVSLYGLILITGRKVNYGPIDPPLARQIFIREALIHGHYRPRAPFLEHNARLLSQIEDLEAKARRRDILVDQEWLLEFYAERVPHEVFDEPRFERWRKRMEREQPQLLFLRREQLMQHEAEAITEEAFPDRLQVGTMQLALDYRFEPGEEGDGLMLSVPLAALNQLEPAQFDWLVPGLLTEKMIALLRTLPKALRRNFVPVPDFARVCRESTLPGDGVLTEAMGRVLLRVTGVQVPDDAWRSEDLPAHLRMLFRVVDSEDKELARSRDLAALKARFGEQAAATFQSLSANDLERVGLVDWSFDTLPERIEVQCGVTRMVAFPALVERRKAVDLTVLETADKAQAATRRGVRRLLMLRMARELRSLMRDLRGLSSMCLQYAAAGPCDTLREDLQASFVDRACLDEQSLPTCRREFERVLERGKSRLPLVAEELREQVAEILALYHAVHKNLRADAALPLANAFADLRSQLEELVYPGFILATPVSALERYPRYLKAASVRLERLRRDPQKDRIGACEIMPRWKAFLERSEAERRQGVFNPELEQYRWMLEEFRVSLFAQHLGTIIPVSSKRLDAQWAKLT